MTVYPEATAWLALVFVSQQVVAVKDVGEVLAGRGDEVCQIAHAAAEGGGEFMSLAFAAKGDEDKLLVLGESCKGLLEAEHPHNARVCGAVGALLRVAVCLVAGAGCLERDAVKPLTPDP